MNVLTSDFETTTSNNGNTFDVTNKAVCLGIKYDNESSFCLFDLHDQELGSYTGGSDDLLVFFNAKFDLHWYRRLGVEVGQGRIHDCQLAEFLLSGQTERFPSLENTAIKYGLGHKLDVVRELYWNKGINTDAIPQEVLSEYCCQDVDLTYQIFLIQQELFKERPLLFKLFKLQCQDLLVLEEMEHNGLIYNPVLCEERSKELTKEIEEIQEQLGNVYSDIDINFGSGNQLSAFLYGGVVYEDGKELVGTFKTGAKAGQPKYRNIVVEHPLPRLVEPLKGSELKNPGFFKTDEGTLKKLKGPAAKKFVAPLLRLAELQKLVGTYYEGIPQLAKEMNWPENEIHGQFNQCVAATGRLSSSQPNLQNFAGSCEDIFISRYND